MPIEGKARALLGLGVAGCVCALLFAVPSWQIHGTMSLYRNAKDPSRFVIEID